MSQVMSGNPINDRAFQYYSRLKRVKEYINDNYDDEEISLEKIASIAAMERTYFSAYFSKKVGITFTDWLRRIRVGKAIGLMEVRDTSILRIAFEVGFGDLGTFERAFKRYTGRTPSDFRKSLLPETADIETTRPEVDGIPGFLDLIRRVSLAS